MLALFYGFVSQAQVNPVAQDTVKKGYSLGKVELKDPKSVLSAYTYDPATDRYIYTNTIDGFPINYPIILTPKEYRRLGLERVDA